MMLILELGGNTIVLSWYRITNIIFVERYFKLFWTL